METQNTFTMEISVDLDDVLQHIYAQSAWHCAHNKQLYRLTSDNSTMLSLKVKEAFRALFTTETAVEDHDLTLINHRIFGYKVADFADAILGDEEQLKKLLNKAMARMN
jgi:hypothetical protein